jgi:chemosensory pili system protein ChpA (sensor histidine kinase/response regulator)
VVGETPVDEALARALHTMHGSAHMADAHAIAELAGELERLLKMLLGSGLPVSTEVCHVLERSVVIIESMLSSLPEKSTVPQDYSSTLQQARELFAAISAANYAVTPLNYGDDEETTQNESEGQADIATIPEEQAFLEEAGGRFEDYYSEYDAELLEIFLEEGAENIETCDAALQRWRESPDDREALAELQRALHTLKGGARMADLSPIGDVAHAAESLIIGISEGRTGCGETALDSVQRAQDRLAEMLDRVRCRRPVEAADNLVAELNALRTQAPPSPSDSADDDHSVEAGASIEVAAAVPEVESSDIYAEIDPEILQVFLEEASDIMEHCEQTLQGWKQNPADQSLMAELQRELHTLKGGARMADVTEIGDLAHAVESLMVKITEGQVASGEVTFKVLEQAHDALAVMVEQVRSRRALKPAERIITDLEQLREGLTVAEPVQTEMTTKATRVAVEAGTELEERRAKSRSTQELVRVKADLLDNMVNYAGEVSIYRSRLEQQVGAYSFNLVEMEQTVARVREQLRKLEIETEAQVLYRYERESELLDEAADSADFDPLEMDRYSHMQQLSRSLMESVSDLSSIQNLLENITRESETLLLQQARVNTELQEGLMRTRMVPFLGLAPRMRRIVRQTAQELGKKAELELSGAEGEMDRTVVDRIVAPLEHMLRNAISHAIESPQERREKGKPETGTIKITLERESSDVVLRIADDGAGINLKAIRKKAIERGLMQADSDLTDNEVLHFILETGFSTAEKVTQVAGRGVGMDVVNSEVKQLGGSLHIDSAHGRGTTFTIRLPFTLALNQALLIEVGEDTYAIPLSSIEGIVRMRREDLKAHYDDPNTRFDYGGYAYEVRHLGTVLGTGMPHLDGGPKRLPVLLARVGDHCVGFHVENLLGSREIVVKSVGPQISTVPGLSGATILGDGRVVMILDIAALLRGVSTGPDQINNIISQPVRSEGLTVMVVDDSITVRKVTARLLERNDMHVIAAKDGIDAVSKLQENIPDIMLLDIEMPRMDGFELATHVRNEPRLRDIPIIMITSRTGDKHRQRAMQIGVNRYLGKPFQESELLENIQALLEETRIDG